MKISKTAIFALRGAGADGKQKLAGALGVSDPTVYRYIQDNETNGALTKAMAIRAISEITGLSEDLILEEEPVKETN